MDKTEILKKAYIEYLLTTGQTPVSIFIFAKKLKISEAEFYEQYNSFEQLESAIWLGFFEEARQRTEAEPVYAQYSVREKLLTFYYTWIEVLKANRSYVLITVGKMRGRGMRRAGRSMDGFRRAFENFITDLLLEGRESREVKQRPFVSSRYPAVFYTQALFLLDFWVRDTSKGFEKTDTAIEKAVNTSFDLIGASALDSVFDLTKFLFQNRR
ncbi:MAG: TetR/AcrR family transcriptional regulator [Cytophagaceae bacterium]|nr:TetR/AcrR family transcriptional regulator [Cytophagaceae bacterium]